MLHHKYFFAFIVFLTAGIIQAQEKQPATEDTFGASAVEVYKTIGDVKLSMRIYTPEGHKPSDKRPAIVFFFGGGWRSGSPKQFAQHSRYLASRGMVAMTAEYRVYNRHKVKVAECVADAKSAIRWVRANAVKLGVDPERIAAGGGSAGGHLAAAVATLEGFDAPVEDASVSTRPNALVLFNPALDLRAKGFDIDFQSKRYQEIVARLGGKPEQLSPTLNVKKGTPPTIIFHGKNDTTVPYAQAEAFAAAMKKAGSPCELAGYEGQAHGFFNFGRDNNKHFLATTRQADQFLTALGYLKGDPTIDKFLK